MSIKSLFENIADAIKTKGGTSTTLTPAEMPRAILDLPTGSSTASGVTYDNTAGGLTANNVQDAIDELAEDVSTIYSDLSELERITTTDLGGGATLRVCGNRVELDIVAGIAGQNTQKTICTLPAGYRPPNDIYITQFVNVDAALSICENVSVFIQHDTGLVQGRYIGKTTRTGDWSTIYGVFSWFVS